MTADCIRCVAYRREGVMNINSISGEVVDSAMRVHSALGPGLLESAYKACLVFELRKRGLEVNTEVRIPIRYDGTVLRVGYRIDLLVESAVVVETKAVRKLLPVDEAQMLSYLTLGGFKLGLLINFHVPHLRHGIRRFANGL